MTKTIMDIVKNTAGISGKAVVYTLVFAASSGLVEDIIDKVRFSGNVKYSDAVKVITDSGMFSADKQQALAVLKQNKDADFYKAVIQVVKSNMYSSDKLKTITNLCKEEEA